MTLFTFHDDVSHAHFSNIVSAAFSILEGEWGRVFRELNLAKSFSDAFAFFPSVFLS